MNKSDIIKKLQEKHPNLPKQTATQIVEVIFARLTKALVEQDRIELRGFGTFSIRKRQARKVRNPKTNEVINMLDRFVVYFRSGKASKKHVNGE